jgi:hypothetical protein
MLFSIWNYKRKNYMSFGSPAKKIAKLVMATDATLHHMRSFTQIFSNQKILNFLCTICSLSFNGKQYLFFVEWSKILRKKLTNFLPRYFSIRKLL